MCTIRQRLKRRAQRSRSSQRICKTRHHRTGLGPARWHGRDSRKELRTALNVDFCLELLMEQAQTELETALPYGNHIASFEAEEPRFYPPPRAFIG